MKDDGVDLQRECIQRSGAKFGKPGVAQVLDTIGRVIARYLEKPVQDYEPFTTSDPAALRKSLEPGDVFLSYSASERWAGFGAGRLETVWLRISRRTRRDRCGRNQDLPHICDALEPASQRRGSQVPVQR